jgi:heme oxygenase
VDVVRKRLKIETALAHQRLDHALIKHDLTSRQGLSDYLRVHYIARYALNSTFSVHNNDKAISYLSDDLATLGVTEPVVEIKKEIEAPHPLGLTYVIAGSSLGSKVLFSVWNSSTDKTVKRAGKFMAFAKDSSDWRDFLAHIAMYDYSEEEIKRIVRSANYCFAVFESANERMIRGR